MRIRIVHDEMAESPRKDFDHLGKMVCWHNGYDLGDEQPSCDALEYLQGLACELDPTVEDRIDYWENGAGWAKLCNKGGTYDERAKACEERIQAIIDKAIDKHTVMLPLHLYDHGGITMSTGGFSCPWDSGQVGFIYISREDVLKEGPRAGKRITKGLRDWAVELLKGEVKEYDQYLTGDVWGFIIESDETCESCEHTAEVVHDSCWGFYGAEYCMEQALESAFWPLEKAEQDKKQVA
ncbi:MAG: hypothetical protein HQ559_01840 [Lentisphaerae bacterium]|nr:hypothetical protein [Lentisphaerota bacterium]